MSKLRQLARGRECLVRIEGVCCFDPETTVLAHARLIGIGGMGIKVPDVLAAHACHACHTCCDTGEWNGQRFEREYLELQFLRGVMRTQALLIREGVLRW